MNKRGGARVRVLARKHGETRLIIDEADPSRWGLSRALVSELRKQA